MSQATIKETLLGLTRILEDSVKGAAELLSDTLDYLEKHPELLSIENGDDTLRVLKRTRPVMAPFSELAMRIEQEWRSDPGQSAEDIVATMRKMVEEAGVTIGQRTAEKFKELAPVSLITLTYSSTVIEAILAAKEHIAEIRVLESLPGGEGANTVNILKKSLKNVELVQDDQIEEAVTASTVGMAGADTVFMDGVIVNKTKTLPMAQLLHDQGKPFFVTSSRWKFSSIRSHEMKEAELDRFERIPSKLITDIISDEEL